MPAIPLPPRLADPAAGVTLRPLRGRDAPALAAALGSDARGARRYLAAQARERARGRWLALAVSDARGDELLGHVALHSFAWRERRAEVACWLVPGARGRGAGSAALRLLADWALGPLRLACLELRAAPGNAAVRRAAEAAGFRLAAHASDGSRLMHKTPVT